VKAHPRPQSRPNAGRAGNRRSTIWRVHDIIKRLQARPFQSAAQLAEAIEGVSTKTILRDVKFMKEQLDLPLKYHEKKHGFHFTEPVSEFAPMQLSRGELVALFVAEKAVEPLKGTRLHKLVHDSLHKIAEACPESVSLHWADLDEAFSMKTTGVLKSDVTAFMKLMDAVLEHREVVFDYPKSNGRGLERRQVHAYHVGQLQNGWYLIAHDPARGALRKFALQRMSGLELLKSRFERDPKFNMRDYLGSGFGVWSYPEDAPRFEVRIRFTGWAARFVAERQWHESQTITSIKDDGSVIEFRAELAGLEEITRWVLGHGRHAKVLAPKKLRDAVHAEARAMLEI
jgi:predicted DNA-binding transcriptional regulator YafY